MSVNHSKNWLIECKKCKQSISLDEEYLHDGEDPIHIGCYLCSNCRQSLAGKFYYRCKDPHHCEKKMLFCDSCYHRLASVCHQCLKIIDDISLIYGERTFHPNCFLCHHCQRPFKGVLIFPYENQVYCAKCYSNVQKFFRPASSAVLTFRCSVCRKTFEPGELITKHQMDVNSETVHYIHNSCFVCEICHQNLSNSVYFSPNTHDGELQQLAFQCEKCHQTSATICSMCFKASDDLMIIFNHRWYHDECFKCKNCRYKLKNLTRIINEPDDLLCERCMKLIRDQQQ